MKKQKKLIINVAILFLFVIFGTTIAKAQNYGLDTAANEAKLPIVTSIPTYAGNIIGAGLSMVSIVFFVLMLYAGIRWMISRGNEEEETKAKDMIISAVIGMVIIMASYALTNFVFKGSTGGNVPKASATATQPPSTVPSEPITTSGAKCVVKIGVTEKCQNTILVAYNKTISEWNEAHKNDLDFVKKLDVQFITNIKDTEFLKVECNKQEDICEISPTIGVCVSLGGSYCSLPDIVNNEYECKQVPAICEWK